MGQRANYSSPKTQTSEKRGGGGVGEFRKRVWPQEIDKGGGIGGRVQDEEAGEGATLPRGLKLEERQKGWSKHTEKELQCSSSRITRGQGWWRRSTLGWGSHNGNSA